MFVTEFQNWESDVLLSGPLSPLYMDLAENCTEMYIAIFRVKQKKNSNSIGKTMDILRAIGLDK